jgi:glycolate oxidase iron-sulfur subunit
MNKATVSYFLQIFSEARCIQCGRCLEVCPVFSVTNAEELSPRAKAVLLQNMDFLARVQSSDSRLTSNVRALAGLCVGCGRCARVCPQQVNIPALLSKIKSLSPGWKGWFWEMLIKYGFCVATQDWAEPVLGLFLPAARKEYLTALSRPETVRPWLRIKGRAPEAERVVVFPGCLGRLVWPHLLEKAERLLKNLGYELLPTPDWACCGFTFRSAGLLEEQKRCQEINFSLWEKLGQPKIVTFCATCGQGLRDISDSDFTKFKESIVPFEDLIGFAAWTMVESAAADGDMPENILWHKPCHAREHEFKLWQEKFEMAGVKLDLNKDYCCGLGGSLQIEAPDLSRQVSDFFWQNLAINSKTHVLSSCNGCVLQLKAARPEHVQVSHWLEIVE